MANQIARVLSFINPAIIWIWVGFSLAGLFYAIRLWIRAHYDLRVQRAHPRNDLLIHIATANLQRVEVRVGMFLWFIVVGVCAEAITLLDEGALREAIRLVSILALLYVNGLVAFNSYRDDRNDLVLQTMLQRDERARAAPYIGKEGC